jgi:hypothetical protein
VRFSLLLFLLLTVVQSQGLAAWTGIGAFVGQGDSDWVIDDELRNADQHQYGLYIEDNSSSGLLLGASAGQYSLRLTDPSVVDPTEKYDGQFLSFYLRLPYQVNEFLTLHSRFDYRYNLGSPSGGEAEDEINWNQLDLSLGVAFRTGIVSIQPYMNWRKIDGDITIDSSTRVFGQRTRQDVGLIVDLYTEPTAFVRIKGASKNYPFIWLGFIREYQ